MHMRCSSRTWQAHNVINYMIVGTLIATLSLLSANLIQRRKGPACKLSDVRIYTVECMPGQVYTRSRGLLVHVHGSSSHDLLTGGFYRCLVLSCMWPGLYPNDLMVPHRCCQHIMHSAHNCCSAVHASCPPVHMCSVDMYIAVPSGHWAQSPLPQCLHVQQSLQQRCGAYLACCDQQRASMHAQHTGICEYMHKSRSGSKSAVPYTLNQNLPDISSFARALPCLRRPQALRMRHGVVAVCCKDA